MTAPKKRRTSAEYAALGAKGGRATAAAHGTEHYVAAGKRGGNSVKAKYGVDHFAELGRRGGARLRELAARGRAAEKRGRKSA